MENLILISQFNGGHTERKSDLTELIIYSEISLNEY